MSALYRLVFVLVGQASREFLRGYVFYFLSVVEIHTLFRMPSLMRTFWFAGIPMALMIIHSFFSCNQDQSRLSV